MTQSQSPQSLTCRDPLLYSADNLRLYHAHEGPNSGAEHSHDDVQVSLALSGACRAAWQTAAGRRRQAPVSPGTVLLCAPRQPHAIQVDRRAELAAVWLPAALLTRAAEEMDAPGPAELADAEVARDPLLHHLCRALLAEVGQDRTPARLYVDAAVNMLAAHLVRRHFPGRAAARETGGLPPRTLRRVMDYVQEHLDQDVSLADLAGLAGLSESRFGPLFRQSTGLSPYQYVLAERVECAKGLLCYGRLSIGEVALRVGFCDQSQFTRQFKKHVGLTPKRFARDSLR